VKCVFSVSAFLISNTLQTTSPFTDAVINKCCGNECHSARSSASTNQWCQTSCHGRLAPAETSK